MATFNVFVQGPVDDSPTALPELAEAMSLRYGLPASELVSRLKRGRFRVKSNVDEATAARYRGDLEAIGARVVIEDSLLSPTATPVAGTPIMRPSNPSLPPATRGATPASGLAAAGPRESVPPPNRPSTPLPISGPTQPRPTTPMPLASGLAAAYTESSKADLGALGDESALSLASLDGESAPDSTNTFDAPPEAVVTFAPKAKAPEAPKPAAKPKPNQGKAMDLFAPPDAGDQDLRVDLAVEEVEDRAKKAASAPPPNTTSTPASSGSLPSMRRNTPTAMAAEPFPVTATARGQFSREKFAAGIVLALVIGFVPVHLIASRREKSAFASIDAKVESMQAAVDSTDAYLALDGAREKLLDEKQSKRQSIALTSMLMWAVISAGVAFGLFRSGRFGETS